MMDRTPTRRPPPCAPLRLRARGLLGLMLLSALAGLGLLAGAAGRGLAGPSRLQETVEQARQKQARDVPVEVYLRALVRADSGFRADSTCTPERLPPDLRAQWDGLEGLLTPEMQIQFLGLSTDALREEWLRRYWRLRDPTPTTPANERLIAHEDRVAEARERFKWKEPPGWDDRGRIWIQFGAPDSVIEDVASVEDGVGFVPGHQEWIYLAERWVVEFERPNPRGPWRLGKSSARLSYRPDLVARDRLRLGYDPRTQLPTAGAYERAGDLIGFDEERMLVARDALATESMSPDLLRHEVRTDARTKELLRKRQEALVRFRKQYEAGGDRFVAAGTAPGSLWYVFDVDAFKGPPGRTRVEVHYQINLQDLKFAWRDSTYVAGYHAEALLLDEEAREAARDSYTERIRADEFGATLAAQLVPGQMLFEVPPGRYRLELRITDAGARSEGSYVTAIEVPSLDGRVLALSDIQMATSIVYAGDDWRSRFVKRDRLIVPNPIKAYPRGRQLTGYFEIYGLALGADRLCRYEVQYTIAPRRLSYQTAAAADSASPGRTAMSPAASAPFVTARFTDEGAATDLPQELRVDIGALAADTYELVLTVRDLQGGGVATARNSFAILE